MGITPVALTAAADITDLIAYNTASVSVNPGELVLISYMGSRSVGASVPPTITGLSTTWVDMLNRTLDTIAVPKRRCGVMRTMVATPQTGAITITWAAAQEVCMWSVSKFIGVAQGGTFGSSAIDGSTGGGVADSGTTRAFNNNSGGVGLLYAMNCLGAVSEVQTTTGGHIINHAEGVGVALDSGSLTALYVIPSDPAGFSADWVTSAPNANNQFAINADQGDGFSGVGGGSLLDSRRGAY